MKIVPLTLLLVAALLFASLEKNLRAAERADASSSSLLEWTQLPSIPDREGFAGPFAGVSGGALLVAGGANFPDKKPWEGGTKVWRTDPPPLPPFPREWRQP